MEKADRTKRIRILVAGNLDSTHYAAVQELVKSGLTVRAREPDIVNNILTDLNNVRRIIPVHVPEVTQGLYDVKYNNVTLPYLGLKFTYKESPPFSSKHQVCRKVKKRTKNKKTHLKKKR